MRSWRFVKFWYVICDQIKHVLLASLLIILLKLRQALDWYILESLEGDLDKICWIYWIVILALSDWGLGFAEFMRGWACAVCATKAHMKQQCYVPCEYYSSLSIKWNLYLRDCHGSRCFLLCRYVLRVRASYFGSIRQVRRMLFIPAVHTLLNLCGKCIVVGVLT